MLSDKSLPKLFYGWLFGCPERLSRPGNFTVLVVL